MPAGKWLSLTARTAAGHPGEIGGLSPAGGGAGTVATTDPEMAHLSWLWWEPGSRLIVRVDGTMPLWLRPEDDPDSVAVVEPGQELALSVPGSAPRWSIHFGPPGQPHRVIRFTTLNTNRTGKAAT